MTRRYFVHPESCCASSEDDGTTHTLEERDPLVEEVSYEEYLKACAAFGEDPG